MYSKVSDKMAYANSVDPDQTAPYIVYHSTKFFKKQLHKKQNLCPKSMD